MQPDKAEHPQIRPAPAAGPSAIYFVTHNRNMVRIFIDAYRRLQADGIPVCFAVPAMKRHRAQAKPVLDELGLEWLSLMELKEQLRAKDIVVVGTKQAPPHFPDAIKSIQEMGVRVVGVVDGCRFAIPNRYEGVDRILVWGQSGKEAYKERARVVGSPVLEATRKVTGRQSTQTAVINFKFMDKHRINGQANAWLNSVLDVCRACNLTPIVSKHPSAPKVADGVEVSSDPIEALLEQHNILISRFSTTVYQALISGAQPFIYSLKNDRMVEFQEPHGAFTLSYDAEALQASLQNWQQGNTRFSPDAFLNRHLSKLEDIPATHRIAEELKKLLAE